MFLWAKNLATLPYCGYWSEKKSSTHTAVSIGYARAIVVSWQSGALENLIKPRDKELVAVAVFPAPAARHGPRLLMA